MDPHKKRIRDVIKLAQSVTPLLPVAHAGPGRGNKKSPKELATLDHLIVGDGTAGYFSFAV